MWVTSHILISQENSIFYLSNNMFTSSVGYGMFVLCLFCSSVNLWVTMPCGLHNWLITMVS